MFVFPAALWRRYVELLDHRHAQPGQSIRRFVTFPTLVVAQKRKNQPPPVGRFRKARKSSHVLDRARLRVYPSCRRRVLHAVFQRAVNSGHRQRRKIRPEPGLLLGKV